MEKKKNTFRKVKTQLNKKKLKRAVNNCENVTTHFSVLVIPKKEGRKERTPF